jgi:hypothetical protein
MKAASTRTTKAKQTGAEKPALSLVKSSTLAEQLYMARAEVVGVLEMLRAQAAEIDAIHVHARLIADSDREAIERMVATAHDTRLSALRCAVDALEHCDLAARELRADDQGAQEAS